MTLLMSISQESKLSDIEALLDSYAVVLSRDTKALQSGPLWQLETTGGIGIPRQYGVTDHFPEFDPRLDVCMIRYEPEREDVTRRPVFSRWPFFVESALRIVFSVGAQWWRFDFVPGETYTDRTPAALPQSENLSPQANGGLSKNEDA